jgi:hypothetical protein
MFQSFLAKTDLGLSLHSAGGDKRGVFEGAVNPISTFLEFI